MTISAPVALGTATSTASTTTLVITTTTASAAGACIVVAVGWVNVATTLSSVTDSAGNSYTVGTLASGTNTRGYFAFSPNAKALASSGTITFTFALAVAIKGACAVSVAGLSSAPADTEGAGATGTSTLPTITGATLAQPDEIVFGFTVVNAGNADAFIEASGFTSNASALPSGCAVRSGYKIVSATAAVTYAPTLGTSRTWVTQIKSFKAAVYPFNPSNQRNYLEM